MGMNVKRRSCSLLMKVEDRLSAGVLYWTCFLAVPGLAAGQAPAGRPFRTFMCQYWLVSGPGGSVPSREPANLQPRNQHPKPAILLHPLFELLKLITHKLGNLPAPQTSHVNMIPAQLPLVIMPLAVDVHQVKFIDHPLPLQQPQRPIHRTTIHAGIKPLRPAQNLTRIQMFARSLNHAQDRAPLPRHTNAALGKLRL